jgi:2-keto-3-deoxy-6-phosphogluconate aldolase
VETARACLDAVAKFLTSPGLDLEIVEFAVKRGVLVVAAVNVGPSFVKIFPCTQVAAWPTCAP